MTPTTHQYIIRLVFIAYSITTTIVAQAGSLNTIEHNIEEPVFKGKALIYENGDKKNKSVVLVHGLGNIGAQDWSKLIPVLAKKYHVISFDLPGFGRSSKGNHNYSPENYANFVNWVVNQYVEGDYILVGHSMGGAISLYFAAHFPRQLEQLVLVDAAGILHRLSFSKYAVENFKPTSWWPDVNFDKINSMLPFNIESLERFPLAFDLIVATAFTRQRLLGGDPMKIAGLSLVLQNFSDIIERINTPTQIIWGEKDPIAPLRTGQLLAGRMANARLHVIKETGHNPMQQNPKEFNQLVLNIISSGPLARPEKRSAKTNSNWFSFLKGDRDEKCSGESNKRLTGNFKKIILHNCQNVKLEKVYTEYLELSNSSAIMIDSNIIAKDIALKMLNSKLTATTTNLKGDVAIQVSNSKLDLAGVNIVARKETIQSTHESSILFSVSHISSPAYSGSVHELLKPSSTEPTRF